MTKKMTSIVKTYKDRMNQQVWLYEHGFITYEEAREKLNKECKMFDEMRTSMFYYHLISEDDFMQTTNVAFDVDDECFSRLLEIKVSDTNKWKVVNE